MINKQILVTSINKEINKSKKYGKLDLTILYFFNLLRYYIDYTNNKIELNAENKHLKLLIQNLKYKYPDIICNYKIIDSQIIDNNILPPTISNNQVDLNGMYYYTFKNEDFIENYTDTQNLLYNKLIIFPSKLNQGKLLFNDVEVTSPLEIDLLNDFILQYTFDSNGQVDPFDTSEINKEEINQIFDFKVSNQKNIYSVTKEISITNSVYQVNQSATIGDIFITADNRTETTLNLNTFTNLMSPPYSDPENDLIDAIRIDSISSSNQGVFLYNGIQIQDGDIISKADLEADLFKHIGPNTDSLATDSLEFSARDSGSLIWVQ